MSNVPDHELLSAYLDGELNTQQRASVEQWLSSDPAARQLLDELQTLSTKLQQLPRYKLGEDITEQVLREAERQMLTRPTPAVEAGRSRWWGLVRRLSNPRVLCWPAAAVAVALMLMLFGSPQPDHRDVAHVPPDGTSEGRSSVAEPVPRAEVAAGDLRASKLGDKRQPTTKRKAAAPEFRAVAAPHDELLAEEAKGAATRGRDTVTGTVANGTVNHAPAAGAHRFSAARKVDQREAGPGGSSTSQAVAASREGIPAESPPRPASEEEAGKAIGGSGYVRKAPAMSGSGSSPRQPLSRQGGQSNYAARGEPASQPALDAPRTPPRFGAVLKGGTAAMLKAARGAQRTTSAGAQQVQEPDASSPPPVQLEGADMLGRRASEQASCGVVVVDLSTEAAQERLFDRLLPSHGIALDQPQPAGPEEQAPTETLTQGVAVTPVELVCVQATPKQVEAVLTDLKNRPEAIVSLQVEPAREVPAQQAWVRYNRSATDAMAGELAVRQRPQPRRPTLGLEQLPAQAQPPATEPNGGRKTKKQQPPGRAWRITLADEQDHSMWRLFSYGGQQSLQSRLRAIVEGVAADRLAGLAFGQAPLSPERARGVAEGEARGDSGSGRAGQALQVGEKPRDSGPKPAQGSSSATSPPAPAAEPTKLFHDAFASEQNASTDQPAESPQLVLFVLRAQSPPPAAAGAFSQPADPARVLPAAPPAAQAEH